MSSSSSSSRRSSSKSKSSASTSRRSKRVLSSIASAAKAAAGVSGKSKAAKSQLRSPRKAKRARQAASQLVRLVSSTTSEAYGAELRALREQATTVVLCTRVSPDGRFVVAGTSGGRLSVWALEAHLNQGADGEVGAPLLSWVAHSGPIYALEFVSATVLVTAGDDVVGWDWSMLPARPERTFTWAQPTPGAETNALALTNDAARLVCACGDGSAYVWDMESGKMVRSTRGTASLYCTAWLDGSRLATGGEEGVLRLWDVRAPPESACTHALDPTNGKVLTRTEAQQAGDLPWISCLDADRSGEWLVCGGGSRFLSLWHLSSETVTATMPTAGTPQVALFPAGQASSVLSAGNEPYFFDWKISGKLGSRVETRVDSVFALAVNPTTMGVDNPLGSIVVGGAGTQVEYYVQPGVRGLLLAVM